jgi:hypothetical protein
MEGSEIVDKADKLKALAGTGDAVFGWNKQAAAPTLRLELIAGAVGSCQELPAMELDCEVTPAIQQASPSIDGTATNP